MVEDAWQQQGQGSRLLRALAVEAANRGVETLTCLVQSDDKAVLRTIRRAGAQDAAYPRRRTGALPHPRLRPAQLRREDRTSAQQPAADGIHHPGAGALAVQRPRATRGVPAGRLHRPGGARRRLRSGHRSLPPRSTAMRASHLSTRPGSLPDLAPPAAARPSPTTRVRGFVLHTRCWRTGLGRAALHRPTRAMRSAR